MQYNPLGKSDLQVSEICLGTMTFGEQNSEREAHQQLSYALERGVNFIDVAEMYPTPPRKETQGRTEAYVGTWLKSQARDRIILATKVTGPTARMPWIRSADRRLDRKNIELAVEDSLKRLQTDYIDLYQIHWPDRYVPLFGGESFDPKKQREEVAIAEQLEVFADLVRAGKIRYLGVSNETPWGVCEFTRLAEQNGLPRIVSIQNAYSLLNRTFEDGLAEVCYREQTPLLAYSALAFGWLTGKYLDGIPKNSRLGRFPQFGARYEKVNVREATAAYVDIARDRGLTPVQLALGFVRSRWFVASTIVAATTLEQLAENIATADANLTPEVLADIEKVRSRFPNPAP